MNDGVFRFKHKIERVQQMFHASICVLYLVSRSRLYGSVVLSVSSHFAWYQNGLAFPPIQHQLWLILYQKSYFMHHRFYTKSIYTYLTHSVRISSHIVYASLFTGFTFRLFVSTNIE